MRLQKACAMVTGCARGAALLTSESLGSGHSPEGSVLRTECSLRVLVVPTPLPRPGQAAGVALG